VFPLRVRVTVTVPAVARDACTLPLLKEIERLDEVPEELFPPLPQPKVPASNVKAAKRMPWFMVPVF